jgi:16S rRNA (guanine(966)-N(2))-methyltransferase RsmD
MVSRGAGAGALRGPIKKAGTLRIIGGKWRRSLLPVLDVPGLRPTPDRVRETAFNWILHQRGGTLQGAAVLDPFCGSGALGVEAASRGAGPVVLGDANAQVIASLRATLARLGDEAVTLVVSDALRLLATCAARGDRFGVIFLDPPFASDWIARILPKLLDVCGPAALVYVESDYELTEAESAASGFERLRKDKAGQVFYHLLRRNIDAPVL